MACVLYIWSLFIFSLCQHFGQASRYLPMIVWDHLNPILTCKCNWLTIPNIDVYDQLDFVCPTLQITVGLMDGQSRPTSDMNENIFRRKVEGNLKNIDNLRKALNNDSFCDPQSTDSTKIYSCEDGESGKSFQATIVHDKNDKTKSYNKGDVVVFFNNGDNGKKATLSSLKKKCAMVFVMNITYSVQVKHDISYGKCLNPPDMQCKNINTSCQTGCNRPCPNGTTSVSLSPTPTLQHDQSCASSFAKKLANCSTQTCNIVTTDSNIQRTSTTTNLYNKMITDSNVQPTSTTTYLNASITKSIINGKETSSSKDKITLICNGTTITCETVPSPAPVSCGRGTDESFNKSHFVYGIILGIVISAIFICCIYFLYFRKKAKKCSSCNELRKLSCNDKLGVENKPTALPVAPPVVPGEGFSNESYAPTSPAAPADDPGSKDPIYYTLPPPIICVAHKNRLPSIEARSGEEFLKKIDGGSNSPVAIPVNKDEQELPRCFDIIRVQSPRTVLSPIPNHPVRSSIKKNKRLPSAGTPDTVDSGVSVRQLPSLDSSKNGADRRKLSSIKNAKG